MTVFVVTLTYVVDLAEIDAALDEHAGWLDENYADGVFLASGRQEPRTGGVILAGGVERGELERRLARDPFARRGLATHAVTQFEPSRTAPACAAFSGVRAAAADGGTP